MTTVKFQLGNQHQVRLFSYFLMLFSLPGQGVGHSQPKSLEWHFALSLGSTFCSLSFQTHVTPSQKRSHQSIR